MSTVNPSGRDIRPIRRQHDDSVPAISLNNEHPSKLKFRSHFTANYQPCLLFL